MNEPVASTDAVSASQATQVAKESATPRRQDSFPIFLLKLVVIVTLFRSLVFSPFNIPSESMQPRLVNGDYLLAAKWPYGYSRHSLPFGLPILPEERLLATPPERGDVVIFKQPPLKELDYIKRVIGLPGDLVQMVNGQLYLNGVPVAKQRLSDFEIAVSPNTECYSLQFVAKRDDGTDVCRYPRYRETLPGGRHYEVIDLGIREKDNTEPVLVPAGHLFLMGDNRDNSEDSRFPAEPGRGIGLVPMDNLVGRATIVMWSTDGSAEWFKPWTWFSAARWNRLGGTF